MGPSLNNFGVGLPTQIDVLRRFYNFGRNLSEAEKISQLIREIKAVYESRGILTVHAEHVRLKLKSLIKKAKSIISTRKLQTESQKQKELNFRSSINSLFEISASERSFSSGTETSDELSTTRSFTDSNLVVPVDALEDIEMFEEEYVADLNEDSSDEEYELPRKRQKISKEILNKINSECGQNASFRLMSSYIKIGIQIAGGNPQEYCVSKSQLQNQITKFRSAGKNNTLEQLRNSESKLILLFDTKSCHKLNKRHLGFKTRLVIIARSETSVTTLGSFMINDHRAETIASEICNAIEKYNLGDRIIGMVCDTEQTNTGYLSGVCVRIEEFLERDLVCFLCRHHIYELILKHVGTFLFGDSRAPTIGFGSTELKAAWEHLNLNRFSPYGEEDAINGFEDENIKIIREGVIPILKTQAAKLQIRDDYMELTDLALKFFGESTTVKNNQNKSFMVPGAVNNARWMAKAIYALKCFLFRDQLDLTNQMLDPLRRFGLFVASIYVKYWNWCTNLFNAPINDLRLLKELEKYREIDPELANIAIDQLSTHLTYLSDELVVLSIFSTELNGDEKEEIRMKLTQRVAPRTENSNRYIKDDRSFSSLQLHDFVSDRSMFLFSILDFDISFMEQNAHEWEMLQSYQIARQKLKKLLVVVNDSSERALGQTANAINHQKARTEENLQNFLTSKLSC